MRTLHNLESALYNTNAGTNIPTNPTSQGNTPIPHAVVYLLE